MYDLILMVDAFKIRSGKFDRTIVFPPNRNLQEDSPKVDWKAIGVKEGSNSKKALSSLMDGLHGVIRYGGIDPKVMKRGPELSDKVHSLRMPKYFEKVLGSLDSRIKLDHQDQIKTLHSNVYLKSMLHELGEIITEFSTVPNQLNNKQTSFTKEERHALEKRIAATFLKLAFAAAEQNDKQIFDKPLQDFRKAVNGMSGGEALSYLNENFSEDSIKASLKQDLGKDIDFSQTSKEAAKYLQLFDEVENKVGHEDSIVKVLDDLEGGDCYDQRADITQKSLKRTTKDIERAFSSVKKLSNQFQKLTDFEKDPFKIDLFYKTCANVFDYLKDMCNSVSKAKIDKLYQTKA